MVVTSRALLLSLLVVGTYAVVAAQNATNVEQYKGSSQTGPAPGVDSTNSAGTKLHAQIASTGSKKSAGSQSLHVRPKTKPSVATKQSVLQPWSSKDQHSKAANTFTVDDSEYGDGDADDDDQPEKGETVLDYCPDWRPGTNHQGVTAADRPEPLLNVFSELTLEEYKAVLEYLFGLKHLGLDDLSKDNDALTGTCLNYIHAIHMEVPPKSDVLLHLDGDEHIPPRKARVTVVMCRAEPPSVHDVLVTIKYINGRPVGSNLQHIDILSSTWSNVPYYQRPQGILDENGAHKAIEAVKSELNHFLGMAFKGWAYGEECSDNGKCIDWALTYAQHFSDELPRGVYLQFYWNDSPVNDGNYIHPVPLQMLVAATGKDLSHWFVHKVWFNGACFDSIKDLKHAWSQDTDGLRSNWDYVIPKDEAGIYSTFEERRGKHRGEEQPVGPVVWEPYGRRFTITGSNKISWLGWSLYVGYLPHYGPRFWDLCFKGERIVYELSLQEVLSLHGGDDLVSANGMFLDSAFGLGYNMRPLNQGIDCPMNAAFMDTTVFYGGMPHPKTFKNAICIFEQHTDIPAMRHYSSSFKFYGAVPGAKLVVRMISSVYNFDYIHDLLLSVDGTIEAKVHTSGYIQTAPALRQHSKHFGYPLFPHVAGTVHTQVVAWKADLDIAGVANSVRLHHLKLHQVDNGAGQKVWANKFDAKIAKTEIDTAHNKGSHEPIIAAIINEEETNMWGSPRGYKVQMHSTLDNPLPEDYDKRKGLGFWKWNFVATRHKDTETHSSSCFTQSDFTKPPTNLCDYVDGDSIRKKDVVVWVNAARYHLPVAEDAPAMPTSNPHLGFTLIPFNWADESPATDMANMIQIDKRSKDTSNDVLESLKLCAPSYTKVPFLKAGSHSGDSSSHGDFSDWVDDDDDNDAADGSEGSDADDSNSADGGSNKGSSGAGKQPKNGSDHDDDDDDEDDDVKYEKVPSQPKFQTLRRKADKWMDPMAQAVKQAEGQQAGQPALQPQASAPAAADKQGRKGAAAAKRMQQRATVPAGLGRGPARSDRGAGCGSGVIAAAVAAGSAAAWCVRGQGVTSEKV